MGERFEIRGAMGHVSCGFVVSSVARLSELGNAFDWLSGGRSPFATSCWEYVGSDLSRINSPLLCFYGLNPSYKC